MSDFYSMYRYDAQTGSPGIKNQMEPRAESVTPPLPLPFQMALPPQLPVSNHHMALLNGCTDVSPMLKSEPRTTTPPMALPFMTNHNPQQQHQQHHLQQHHPLHHQPHTNDFLDQNPLASAFGIEGQYTSSFEGLYNWAPVVAGPVTSTAAGAEMPIATVSSPFLHDMAVQNFPVLGRSTVSPRQLHPDIAFHHAHQQQHQHQQDLAMAQSCFTLNQDDIGLFTFSDSEDSLSDRFVPVSSVGPRAHFATAPSQQQDQPNNSQQACAPKQTRPTSAADVDADGVTGLGLYSPRRQGQESESTAQHDTSHSNSRRPLPYSPGHLAQANKVGIPSLKSTMTSSATTKKKALPFTAKKSKSTKSNLTMAPLPKTQASISLTATETIATLNLSHANNAITTNSRRRSSPRQRQHQSATASRHTSVAEPGQNQRHRQRVPTPKVSSPSSSPSLAPSPYPSPTPSTGSLFLSLGLSGHNEPNFVPIGYEGKASAAQGNYWPIERSLMKRIVAAERGYLGFGYDRGTGGEGRRSSGPKPLTYRQIKDKYSRWQHKEPTLRGIARSFQRPKEHRERKPTWEAEHLLALNDAIPPCTDEKGKIQWLKVAHHIESKTGKPFGAGTVAKKWDDIVKGRLPASSLPFSVSQQQQNMGRKHRRQSDDYVENEDEMDSADDDDSDSEDHEGEEEDVGPMDGEKFQDLSISDESAATAKGDHETRMRRFGGD
ncbi:hypothetical protein BD289DRAFT_484693 [Coniella lustricola]|uniref:Myb-like domain-containing protein n=1 Tax=Coniella lustricola TaxID=2025994 RepID=A0A2T3A170_9PEZI|nr:hypothetical protein BD289DRAFT_484693 [Coniella lustricola]